MKSLHRLILFVFLIIFISCSDDDGINTTDTNTIVDNNSNTDETNNGSNTSSGTNDILILGASRVEGNRPVYESFRYELWKDLVENNYTFDFLGVETDPADYPLVNSLAFDSDHEGRGGWTSGQILSELPNSLSQLSSPDIVLFSSPGGNDALNGMSYDDAIVNINAIIDLLQANNPSVTIIIEQMAPTRSDVMTSQLSTYLTALRQDVSQMAINHTTSTSSVVAIDMESGFSDSLLADEVHYNEAGAIFIADRYYALLSTILN